MISRGARPSRVIASKRRGFVEEPGRAARRRDRLVVEEGEAAGTGRLGILDAHHVARMAPVGLDRTASARNTWRRRPPGRRRKIR